MFSFSGFVLADTCERCASAHDNGGIAARIAEWTRRLGRQRSCAGPRVMTRPRLVNRRAFVADALRMCCGAAGAQWSLRAIAMDPKLRVLRELSRSTLRIGVVCTAQTSHGSSNTLLEGIQLGTDEAARAAALLGGLIEMIGTRTTADEAAAMLERDAPAVLVSDVNESETAKLAAQASRLGIVLMNVGATADSLRNAHCARLVFHIVASDAMRADAERMWSSKNAGMKSSHITEWDARLDRFGAAQLNARFASRFSHPMDARAWAGWFAVKVAWEASQRSRSVDGAAIATYLDRPETQFDGQKGVPLSFRSWDHQLRQPLYAVTAEATAEPSPIPAGPSTSARASLDALGTSAEASTCRW